MRIALVLLTVLVAACGNDHRNIHLGDVSLGQQLIDLKAAHEAGAIDEAEYEEARSRLLAAADLYGDLEDESE